MGIVLFILGLALAGGAVWWIQNEIRRLRRESSEALRWKLLSGYQIYLMGLVFVLGILLALIQIF